MWLWKKNFDLGLFHSHCKDCGQARDFPNNCFHINNIKYFYENFLSHMWFIFLFSLVPISISQFGAWQLVKASKQTNKQTNQILQTFTHNHSSCFTYNIRIEQDCNNKQLIIFSVFVFESFDSFHFHSVNTFQLCIVSSCLLNSWYLKTKIS